MSTGHDASQQMAALRLGLLTAVALLSCSVPAGRCSWRLYQADAPRANGAVHDHSRWPVRQPCAHHGGTWQPASQLHPAHGRVQHCGPLALLLLPHLPQVAFTFYGAFAGRACFIRRSLPCLHRLRAAWRLTLCYGRSSWSRTWRNCCSTSTPGRVGGWGAGAS